MCVQVCSAKMADFRRKFTDAARRYIQLSYEPEIHTDERMASLKRAIICTILSSAGNRREREGGRGRDRERQRETEREGDRERDRERERERERGRERKEGGSVVMLFMK